MKFKNCNCSNKEHERLSRLPPEEQEIEQSLRGCELVEEECTCYEVPCVEHDCKCTWCH